MPSILAFFENPQKAYNCLNDVQRVLPKGGKAYTVAQHEYTKDSNESKIPEVGSKISTKIGALFGIGAGIVFSLGINLFHVSHLATTIVLLLGCAGIGGMIGVYLSTAKDHIQHKGVYVDNDRGELILIVEKPGDQQDLVIEIINSYEPSKIKSY